MTAERLTIPIRSDKLAMLVKVTRHVAHRKTEFQEIDVYDTEVFGKMLLLDGHIQLTELDEAAYHEALVQIPMLSLDRPRTALVVGGGDGGVVRELCRHESIERIDMVEIDRGVIEVCQEHLPELNAGAFDDPRVNVLIEDAFPFLKQATGPYDLIVMDSTDTYEDEEGALSEQLFTEDFYRDIARVMADDGLLITQADNLVFCPYSLEGIAGLFSKVFPKVGWYQAIVPSFGGFSGYCWASKGQEVARTADLTRMEKLRLSYLNRATFELAFQPLPFLLRG